MDGTRALVAAGLVMAAITLDGVQSSTEEIPLSGANTAVEFAGTNLISRQTGRFSGIAGTLVLDPAAIAATVVRVTIDMASVKTGDQMLTNHLKSSDFFHVTEFPSATFVSTNISSSRSSSATHMLKGVLSMRGVTADIEVPINIAITADRAKASGTFTLNRRQFNVAFSGLMDKMIRDDVVVTLNVDAERPRRRR